MPLIGSIEELKLSLSELYNNLGIRNAILPFECKYALKCWKEIENRKPPKDKEQVARLYLPYIGNKYLKARILCIGINTNDYWGPMDSLVEPIMNLCLENSQNAYAQTTFFTPVIVAGMILAKLGFSEFDNCYNFSAGKPSLEKLASIYDYVVFTNQVKCSLAADSKENDRGYPSQMMFQNCSQFIAKNEINILAPRIIIVMGKSHDIEFFDTNIRKEIKATDINYPFEKRTKIPPYWFKIDSQMVLRIKHPSYRYGPKQYLDIYNLVNFKSNLGNDFSL